ncbi:hypothetical protein QOZ80_8AG0626580 [Eleusine coracana subsp. coracana]|nr:hypothetical protein QOZ80_8AG0626580 [Eleusine coracana subsp. coracana]
MAAAMVSSSCSALLACAHAGFPLPRPRPPPSLLLARAAAAPVTMAGANGPLFVRRPGGAVGQRRSCSQICRDSSLEGPPPGTDSSAREQEEDKKKSEAVAAPAARVAAGGGGGSLTDWTTSVLLFGVWAGILYYIFQLSPNQTPYRDSYFVQKLLNLKVCCFFRPPEVQKARFLSGHSWFFLALGEHML